MRLARTILAVAVAALTVAAAPADARRPPERKKKPVPRKILRVEEMKVEGRIQKPQAMFLMPRANLSYGELERSEPLLPKITRAVEKEPF